MMARICAGVLPGPQTTSGRPVRAARPRSSFAKSPTSSVVDLASSKGKAGDEGGEARGGTRVRERSSAGRRGRRNVGRSAGVGGREPRRGKDGARATQPGNAPRARARGGANESDRMGPEV